ncbi:cystatin-like [Diaphorina citri]|uniref:Cystatin-like n=1 Tax=Diaphorina citri TaxID=121845 RepID=A0A3Q0IV33_DIACI|nr:cystatin-like [Diaphorina citri]
MIQLDEIDGDNYRRIALDVLSIREQLILDGSVVQYSLTLVSMSTACVERKSLSGEEGCLKEQVAPMETCSVDCVRPVTSGEAPRVVRSVCAPQATLARRDIVGNPVDVATTDEEAADALSFAVGVICEGSSSTNKLGFLKLLSSSRQVVAGILFTFTLQVTRTSCEKTDSSTDCPIEGAGDESDPDFNQCVVKVWDQAWRNPRYTVTDLKCVRPNAKTTS